MGLKAATGRSLLPFLFGDFVTFYLLEEIFIGDQHGRMLLLAFEEYFSCINPSLLLKEASIESDFGLQSSMIHSSL